MNGYKAIIQIGEENNGYVLSRQVKARGIPSVNLTRMVRNKSIAKLKAGVYLLPDYIEDPFYTYSISYSKLVFSKETALYLNKLSNRQIDCYHATFPFNSNFPRLDGFVIHKTRKADYYLGVAMVETPYGNEVKAYDKERCICDLFIDDSYDSEDRSYAIKHYRENDLDLKKLYEYAKQLNIFSKVKNVFEVIAWN